MVSRFLSATFRHQPNGLMLSATESAMCSFETTPMISEGRPRPRSLTTTAMAASSARHALNDIEHDIGFARDGEIALRDVANADAAVGLLDTAPQAGVDAHDAGNAVAARHDDVPEAAFGCVLAQERVEVGIRRQERYVALHDIAGAAHQEHVGVQRLRHEMPRPTSFIV